MKYYLTEMLRWGDQEAHHYPIGIYSTFTLALKAGQAEEAWRGGKYKLAITAFELDAPIPPEKLENE